MNTKNMKTTIKEFETNNQRERYRRDMLEIEIKGSTTQECAFMSISDENVKMGDIFSYFTQQNEQKYSSASCRFLFEGERIGDDATPKSLGLSMNDSIDCCLEQEGGVGGTRMPHNNRVSSSASMKMTDIWTNTIKYDPYAAEGELEDKAEGQAESLERAKGIMALAKISNAAQGNSERSTDFSRQVFWGLKRRAPPKGYEVPVLSEEDSSDSDEESEEDGERDSNADDHHSRDISVKTKRSRSPSPSRSSQKRSKDSDRERKSSKKSKAKKEKKGKKSHKKSHKKKHRDR
mmetsp:Transcript_11730/g.14165  ORF Transcript_11730/g.14165 Transcript_11730/m.14165 type:complete len:291 (+) Transcript_11730:25-897(+)